MKITIGQTSEDRRVLNKTFSGTEITVAIMRPCDILNPIFILDYNVNWLTCNYLYCPDFNRYYFINNLTVNTAQRIELSCSVDVLMTYRNQINNITCNVVRNENLRTPYIADSNKPLTTKTQTQTYVFDKNPFVAADGYTDYVLSVIGGVQ